ncbi:MAG: TolC family protein [Bacillota bacterium]
MDLGANRRWKAGRAVIAWLLAIVSTFWLFGPLARLEAAAPSAQTGGQQPGPARETFTLESAVENAVRGAALDIARLALASARVDFERAMADNLLSASPLAEQMARHNLRKAEDDFRDSHFQAVASVIAAYFDVMNAAEGVRVADLRHRIAVAALEAAREKARVGTLGALELQEVENVARSAAQDLAEARVSLDDARERLARALGYPEVLPEAEALMVPEPIPALPSLSPQEAVAMALEKSGEVASRSEALEIARKQLQQAIAEQAPPLDVRAREYAVEKAELELRQARVELDRSVRLALGQAVNAAQRRDVAWRSLQIEEQRLQGVRQQQQAGLKTEQAVMQAEVATLQARQGYLNAVKGYLTALVDLRRLLGQDPGFGPPTSAVSENASPEGAGPAK